MRQRHRRYQRCGEEFDVPNLLSIPFSVSKPFLLSHSSVLRFLRQNEDDNDLNDMFAVFFADEFNDPLSSCASSMENYRMHASSTNSAQAIGSLPIDNQPGDSTQPLIALPVGGIGTRVGPVPLAKKRKTETAHHGSRTQVPLAPRDKITLPTAASAVDLLSEKGKNSATPSVLPLSPALAHPVVLPVGMGINLGVVSGIAPVSAQTMSQPLLFPFWGIQATTTTEQASSDTVIAERRQRNREHAKRSRVRKKFMLESLQAEVLNLQLENQRLRLLVQEQLPQNAVKIITECCSENPAADTSLPGFVRQSEDDRKQTLERQDVSLLQSLMAGQKCFVLSDPSLPDNPIVYASPGFYEMTGYSNKEVLGRNCRFLQGEGTDKTTVDILRKAVATGSETAVCLLNYKADGTPFWNQLFIATLRDSDNSIVNFVCI